MVLKLSRQKTIDAWILCWEYRIASQWVRCIGALFPLLTKCFSYGGAATRLNLWVTTKLGSKLLWVLTVTQSKWILSESKHYLLKIPDININLWIQWNIPLYWIIKLVSSSLSLSCRSCILILLESDV